MPEEAALGAYNATYFESAHGGIPTDPVSRAFHSAINLLRVAHVERFIKAGGIAVSAVLEIGAGGGHFARHWCARHRNTEYHAIEADESCHAGLSASGVMLHRDASDISNGMDLAVMSHVLEHTTEPAQFLRAMTAPLKRGGALFVEVPCRDWEFKSQDEPHLLFFDKIPMIRLLANVGFGNVEASYHGREIARLCSESRARRIFGAVRARLLARGIVAPFARVTPGLEMIDSPLERAAVRPFEAHREQVRPAWWLRATAQKL